MIDALASAGCQVSFRRQLQERDPCALPECWPRGEIFGAGRDDPRARLTRLEAAVNNMALGICMYDAGQRLVVCNRLYAKSSSCQRNSPSPASRCSTYSTIELPRGYSRARMGKDTFATALPSASTQSVKIRARTQGRPYILGSRSSPWRTEGWVATHEDITERTRADRDLALMRSALIEARNEAERAAKEAQGAHQRLLEAFEVVPEALTLLTTRIDLSCGTGATRTSIRNRSACAWV